MCQWIWKPTSLDQIVCLIKHFASEFLHCYPHRILWYLFFFFPIRGIYCKDSKVAWNSMRIVLCCCSINSNWIREKDIVRITSHLTLYYLYKLNRFFWVIQGDLFIRKHLWMHYIIPGTSSLELCNRCWVWRRVLADLVKS